MSTRTEALDELMEVAVGTINAIASEWENPDEDVHPMLLILGRDEERVLVEIDGEFLGHPLGKDVLAEFVMPMVIREHSGIAAAFISSAWVSSRHRDDPDTGLMPSDDPNRTEEVMIFGATIEETRYSHTLICRDGEHPPWLGEWEHITNQDGAMTDGRFPTALMRGLAVQG